MIVINIIMWLETTSSLDLSSSDIVDDLKHNQCKTLNFPKQDFIDPKINKQLHRSQTSKRLPSSFSVGIFFFMNLKLFMDISACSVLQL